MSDVGVVVIGRNEGERLKVCIRSLMGTGYKLVYVDSDSSDDSVEFVKANGFDVIELDMSIPFSAARARNEGYQFLCNKFNDIAFIQFVDGDCEVCEGWIEFARSHLLSHERLAAVCGRRRERYPDKTIYNKLCDIEWDTPIGLTAATGGDFLSRRQALEEVNGFSPEVIAGEEPEMCFRMRQKGWLIERLDRDMTLHDADMTKISQWWRRSERSGHAYAQGFLLHGAQSPEYYYRKDLYRIVFWGGLIPLISILGIAVVGFWSLLLFSLFAVKVIQLFRKESKVNSLSVAAAYASSLMFGKIPQMKGVALFFTKCILGRKFHIIEYKS